MNLKVRVSLKRDMLILMMEGQLDENTVNDLRFKISKYLDDYNIKHLVLDLSNLNFMDSSGIGFIIGRYYQLKIKSGSVTLVGLNETLEKIVRISGLTKICKIRSTLESVYLCIGG